MNERNNNTEAVKFSSTQLSTESPSPEAVEQLCLICNELDSIDQNGFVDIPDGHGLGVEYDWDFIDDNTIDKVTFGN